MHLEILVFKIRLIKVFPIGCAISSTLTVITIVRVGAHWDVIYWRK